VSIAAQTAKVSIGPSPYRAYCQMLQQQYLDTPMHVHIETVGMCNARCRCCPNAVSPRRTEKMSDELFAKIVEDLKELPQDRFLAISPFKLNEPLVDPKIFQRMKMLAQALPQARLWLTSNWALADEARIRQLAEVPQLGYIWISLNSLDPVEYRQWMGLELERTVENIRRLLVWNRSKRFVPMVILGRVADGTEQDRQFGEDVRRTFADFQEGVDYQIGLLPRGDWMGDCPEANSLAAARLAELPCARWFEVSITCTGQVAFCCMDGLCHHPLGDVNRQSILEIYQQAACRELRQLLPPRRLVGPCAGCTFT